MSDLTPGQFDNACKRWGFIACNFLGYYRLSEINVSVSILNGGRTRRKQLAYLISEYTMRQQ